MDYGFFDEILKEEYPDLFNELHSEQGDLSVELLSIRISTNLDAYKFAKLLGMEVEDYLEYEFGNTSIPIFKFYEVISSAEKIKSQIVLLQKTDSFMKSVDTLKMINNHVSWKKILTSRFTDSIQFNKKLLDIQKPFWKFDMEELDLGNLKEEDFRFNLRFGYENKVKLKAPMGENINRKYAQSEERTIVNV